MTFVPAEASPQLKFFENGQATRTGADDGMFSDTPTRKKIDLAGAWKYSTDGAAWHNVAVPGAYDGTARVTFMRTFDVPAAAADSYAFSLVVYGINYSCEISVNGNFIGRHMGGYSSFVLPMQPGVIQAGGDNAIVVNVDNELTPKTTLPLRQQVGSWRSYGGIFRDIYLLATPRLFIQMLDVRATLNPDGRSGAVAVRAEIADRGSGIKPEPGSLLGLQFEMVDKLTGELSARSGITPFTPLPLKSAVATVQAVVGSPKVWSPDIPDLYVIKCRIVRASGPDAAVLDEIDCDTGLRTLAWSNGRLLVNNAPTALKGILWHEEQSGLGSSMTYEAMERDVASIKSTGANLIRFLYPPHPYMLNLCDRYGILAMEEIPATDVPVEILSKDYFSDLAMNYIKEMVQRDKGHVSVLAWGVGDELETAADVAREYVNSARNIIKSLDDRAVYFVSRNPTDPCFAYVDLAAVNSYQDDPRRFLDFLKSCQEANPRMPVILARYGRNAEPGNRNGYSDPRSLEAQARTIMHCFDAVRESKIAGSVLWSFSDWRSDRPALTTHAPDPYLQSMGIVSYDREKRVAYDVTRALFNGERIQALPIGNYAASAPIIYVLSGLVVLLGFAFLYNANRRFRDCINRSLARTYNFFADVRDQRILAYSHSAFVALVVSVTWSTILSIVFTHYRESLLLDNVLSQILSDGAKEWFIRLVWSPANFILMMSGVVAAVLFCLAVLVKLLSALVRAHVYFYHSFSITMWSMLPYVLLIPLTMILYRLMENDATIVPILGLLLLVTLWVLLRLFKGISIIYDVYPIKVYASGFLLIVVCSAMAYGYLDYTQSTSMYLKYLFQTMKTPM